jgi:hypothetical protein
MKMRQGDLYAILSGRVDIFYPPKFIYFGLKGTFSTPTPGYINNAFAIATQGSQRVVGPICASWSRVIRRSSETSTCSSRSTRFEIIVSALIRSVVFLKRRVGAAIRNHHPSQGKLAGQHIAKGYTEALEFVGLGLLENLVIN